MFAIVHVCVVVVVPRWYCIYHFITCIYNSTEYSCLFYTSHQKETIVGIDLGTTNSLIAIVREDTRQPLALREIDGLTLVPSIVHFDEYGGATVGNTAKEKLIAEPHRTIYSAKRLMGCLLYTSRCV